MRTATKGGVVVVALLAVTLAGVNFGAPRANATASEEQSAVTLPSSNLFVIRVVVRTPAGVAWLTSGGYDVLEARDGDALFVLGNEAILSDLKNRGFDASFHSELTTQNLKLNTPNYFGGYRTVAEHDARMDGIAASRPDLALVVDYGDSWRKANGQPNGHDLKAICITARRPGDCQLNPNTDKGRFFLMAALHPREMSTSEMAWRWMTYLVDNYNVDPDVTALLDTSEMWIVPVANPDGRSVVEQGGNAPYLQRKNLNDTQGACSYPPNDPNYVFSQPGVDLNRNAAFKWGVSGSDTTACSQVFRGVAPASEPEEQALETLMAQLFRDQRGPLDGDAAPITTTGAMLTLHSYSDLVLLPWSWSQCLGMCTASQQAPNDAGLRAFAFRMSYFNGYATGQASELLYPASGTTDDWAYGVLGIPGFTFEIGPLSGGCGGFTPPYACQDNVFWPIQRGAFLYAAKAARQPYALALGPSTFSITLSNSVVTPGTPVTLAAVVNDGAYGNNPQSIGRPAVQVIDAAEVYLDAPPQAGGAPMALAAQDGAFDSPVEPVTGVLDTTSLSAGRHILFVRGRDASGNWGPATAQWLFVTGDRKLYLPWTPR